MNHSRMFMLAIALAGVWGCAAAPSDPTDEAQARLLSRWCRYHPCARAGAGTVSPDPAPPVDAAAVDAAPPPPVDAAPPPPPVDAAPPPPPVDAGTVDAAPIGALVVSPA